MTRHARATARFPAKRGLNFQVSFCPKRRRACGPSDGLISRRTAHPGRTIGSRAPAEALSCFRLIAASCEQVHIAVLQHLLVSGRSSRGGGHVTGNKSTECERSCSVQLYRKYREVCQLRAEVRRLTSVKSIPTFKQTKTEAGPDLS